MIKQLGLLFIIILECVSASLGDMIIEGDVGPKPDPINGVQPTVPEIVSLWINGMWPTFKPPTIWVGGDREGNLIITETTNLVTGSVAVGSGRGVGLLRIQGTDWGMGIGLDIGFRGTGRVEVVGGTIISGESGYIGYFGDGEMMVNGSTWLLDSFLTIATAPQSIGMLDIINGGQVITGTLWCTLADTRDTTATVTVDGQGSLLEASTLNVGKCGYAKLHIKNGGMVRADKIAIGIPWWSEPQEPPDPVHECNHSYVTIASGGQLAIKGHANTLEGFLALIDGTDDIRFEGNYTLDYDFYDVDEYTILTINDDKYTIFMRQFGSSAEESDFNNDGIVDLDDFVILRNNFNELPVVTVTPESSTIALLVLLGMTSRKRLIKI